MKRLTNPIESVLAFQREIERLQNPIKQLMDEERRMLDAIVGPIDSIKAFLDKKAEQERQRATEMEALFADPLQQVSEMIRAIQGSAYNVTEAIDHWRVAFDASNDVSMMAEAARSALDISAAYREAAGLFSDRDAVTGAVLKLNDSAHYVQVLLAAFSQEHESTFDWATAEQPIHLMQEVLAQAPTDATVGSTSAPRTFTPFEWITIWMGTFGVLIALTQVLLQIQANRDQAVESAEERAFERSLLAALKSLKEQAPRSVVLYAAGSRATYVRSTVRGGMRVGRLHPNQLVVVSEKNGRWVKVRFRDHVEDREIEGWVLKHYLIRVAPAPSIPNGCYTAAQCETGN